MNLRFRIAASAIAFGVAACVYLLWLWEPRMHALSEREIGRHTESHLRTVANGLIPLLKQGRGGGLHATAEALEFDIPGLVMLVVENADGRRLHPLDLPAAAEGATLRTFERELRDGNTILGRLRLVIDIGPQLARMDIYHHEFGIVLIGGLFLVLLAMVIFIDLSVRRPAQQLSDAAHRFAEGDFAAELPARSSDEIGELVESFATMRDRIRQHQEAVRRSRDELEARVRERTAELSATNRVLEGEIAERRTAEELLRASEARLKAIFDNAPHSIYLMDLDQRYLLANRVFEERSGLSPAEYVGRTRFELMPHDHAEMLNKHGREVLETNSIIHREYDVAQSGGFTRRLMISKFPVSLDGSEPIGIGGFGLDVSETRRVEEQLRQAQKMEAVGQLTGGIAHEFNNLLTVVLGNIELLQRQIDREGRQSGWVSKIRQAAMRGAKLTNQLLSYSRKQSLQPERVDLTARAEDTVGLLRGALGEMVKLEMAFPDDLWPVCADPGRIEDSLLNLCLNSRDAMPGGGKITVSAENRQLDSANRVGDSVIGPGGFVVLTVADTGTGMTREVIEHAFDPFYTTKEVGKGTGLGLSMVYGFVRQSGGALEIDSGPGRGTRISIHLPRDSGADGGITAQDDAARPLARAQGGETILVVEDDSDVRALISSMLQTLGYRVLEAGDGTAALSLLEARGDISMLLSDVILPGGMHGPRIAERAREMHPEIRILFMSGYPDRELEGGDLADRTATLIRKPISLIDLADKVRSSLAG